MTADMYMPHSEDEAHLMDLAQITPATAVQPFAFFAYDGATPKPGALGACFSRGRYRRAEVMSILGPEMLIELEYDYDTGVVNELRIVRVDRRRIRGTEHGYRPIRYDACPKAFEMAMIQADMVWCGMLRTGRQVPPPQSRRGDFLLTRSGHTLDAAFTLPDASPLLANEDLAADEAPDHGVNVDATDDAQGGVTEQDEQDERDEQDALAAAALTR